MKKTALSIMTMRAMMGAIEYNIDQTAIAIIKGLMLTVS
jgi:hypothetical protein